MTAALDGDNTSAEALAKKGNLLSGEKALAAVENLDLNAKIVVLQNCMIALRMNVPTQIGSAIRPKALESEISSVLLAQKEILAGKPRKIDSYNAPNNVLAGKPRKIDPYNAPNNVLAGKHRKIDSYNALMIGSASRVMEAFNTSLSNVAKNHALNQSQNIGLGLVIGNVISQTAAANNSEKLNGRPPFKEK